MKKELPNTEKTRNYLSTLPKLYVIGCWAGYGETFYHYSGKCTPNGIPIVWDYVDCNGEFNKWVLRPITQTSASVLAWTVSEPCAINIAGALNFRSDVIGKRKKL